MTGSRVLFRFILVSIIPSPLPLTHKQRTAQTNSIFPSLPPLLPCFCRTHLFPRLKPQ